MKKSELRGMIREEILNEASDSTVAKLEQKLYSAQIQFKKHIIKSYTSSMPVEVKKMRAIFRKFDDDLGALLDETGW